MFMEDYIRGLLELMKLLIKAATYVLCAECDH
jgi:hypothetical protein